MHHLYITCIQSVYTYAYSMHKYNVTYTKLVYRWRARSTMPTDVKRTSACCLNSSALSRSRSNTDAVPKLYNLYITYITNLSPT